jgi:alpha-N-arabinofuranosidase
MANIAQMINVLQAMILTDKEKMILTPTYHVYDMYTVHHDARLLPTDVQATDYVSGSDKIPTVNGSASQKEGKIHVSLCNLNAGDAAEVTCELRGAKAKSISGRVLTANEITGHNTFEHPDSVHPEEFRAFKTTETGFSATLPARSVVVLEIE